MENKFGKIISNVGKNAKEILEKTKENAVQFADQNDDGKFDMEDISKIAGTMGSVVKKGANAIKETAEEKARELELKNLQPIFETTLNDFDFYMPKLIRIVDRDKKRSESEVCKGSIGYCSKQKGVSFVNIYRDSVEKFGLTFFPGMDNDFYYVNPADRDNYIALDDYYDQLKIARINELQRIAQDLGARKFKVTYKEEKISLTSKNVKANGKVKAKGEVQAECEKEEERFSVANIAMKMECPPHPPVQPTLKYLKTDPSIQNLIDLRMHQEAPPSHLEVTIKLSNTSGLKITDAIKIDALLNGLKCIGNASVESAARQESRKYLAYEIDF